MDIRKLLGIDKPKRRPGVAQAGVYAQKVDPEGVDPEMRRTVGLTDSSAVATMPRRAEHDAELDLLAKKAGRFRQPYRRKAY